MQEVHIHRGFTVTVLAEDDPAGGSTVTTRIERSDGAQPDGGEWAAPRLKRSRFRGATAIGAAFDDARREIDSALGSDDPLDQ
ncbi:hypothetical protein PQR02_38695 [Paraburkholderia sediminicola]|uniref:Uncharacterized protein n=1 Tax=Paraburkholderia rhynchosiae TaxID=487049 RepID=A0ACC7NS12_9BURK